MEKNTADQAFDIVVRFSIANPDVVLSIVSASQISGCRLKQLIRAKLEPPASTSRLRLIHAGKVVPDDVPLSRSLTVPTAPPQDVDFKTTKAKGKQPVRDKAPATRRLYIHCSIGDALTPAELAAEAKAADKSDAALSNKFLTLPTLLVNGESGISEAASQNTPAPRGFDRLLSAGFTSSEVAALRTQFLAIQAHTHTPDTMPTGQELLALEERWLESGSGPAGGGAENGGGMGFEDTGGLEDMLYGNLIGFFWPIGGMCWLMREEGVWSRRRQIAVLSGFLVNLTFGFLRIMN